MPAHSSKGSSILGTSNTGTTTGNTGTPTGPNHCPKILQINVTLFNKEVLDFVLASRVDVFIIQEHHLAGNKYHWMRRKLERQFHVRGSQARINPTLHREGTTGGTWILVRKCYVIDDSENHTSTFWNSTTVRMGKYKVGIVSLYLHPVEEGENMATLHHIHNWTSRLGIPVFVAGDFNRETDELAP